METLTHEPIINVINLLKRTDRREAVTKQMESENVLYVFWEGKTGPNTKHNIHRAFKNVIQSYKVMGIDRCFVAEDDLVWTAPGAWQYYLDNMPTDFDIFCASYYSGTHDEKNVVKGFRGCTLICVHSRFYDKFLWLPEEHHIDAAMSLAGAKIVTCYPFAATQVPGYSDQRGRQADDSHRLKNKLLFGQ